MLIAAGNINRPYEVLGVVHSAVSRAQRSAGCGKPELLPTQEAFEAATQALVDAAKRSGGDGVIHIQLQHRTSATQIGCNNNSKAVFEVYGLGTAIRLLPE